MKTGKTDTGISSFFLKMKESWNETRACVSMKIYILQAGTAPESLQVIQHAKGFSYGFSAVQPGQFILG